MKRLIVASLVLSGFSLLAQTNEVLRSPQVDTRIELLSIVFRLAGNREYNARYFPKYVEEIEKHFAAHKEHPLVRYAGKLRKNQYVSYDAVMGMAIHLGPAPDFDPVVPFSDQVPEPRWGAKRARKFVQLLRRFYKEADCRSFFERHESLYREAGKRFLSVYRRLDAHWYPAFYGAAPRGEFLIVNGLGNGGGNYGPKVIHPDGRESIYAIMGTWSVDSLGLPDYNQDSYFPILLHEFNHSFVNHLVAKFSGDLRASGQTILKPLREIMAQQAYATWQTVLSEAIVRAAVVKYMKDHAFPADEVQREINTQVDKGFLWTGALVDALEAYDRNREKYPTLESYMPELIKFFADVASRIDDLKATIEARRPKVVSLEPFRNGALSVPVSTTQLTIHFDRPLTGDGYSVNYGSKGEKAFPKVRGINYSDDKRSVLIDLELKPGKEYQMVLTGLAFVAEGGLGMEDYEVTFRTEEK